jgi:hypothetical protein
MKTTQAVILSMRPQEKKRVKKKKKSFDWLSLQIRNLRMGLLRPVNVVLLAILVACAFAEEGWFVFFFFFLFFFLLWFHSSTVLLSSSSSSSLELPPNFLFFSSSSIENFDALFDSFYSAAKRDGFDENEAVKTKLGGGVLGDFFSTILAGSDTVKDVARTEFKSFMADPKAVKLVRCVKKHNFQISSSSWNAFATYFCQHEKIINLQDQFGPFCAKNDRKRAAVNYQVCANAAVALPRGWARYEDIVYSTSLRQVKNPEHPVWFREKQLRTPEAIRYLFGYCKEQLPLDPRCQLALAYSKRK